MAVEEDTRPMLMKINEEPMDDGNPVRAERAAQVAALNKIYENWLDVCKQLTYAQDRLTDLENAQNWYRNRYGYPGLPWKLAAFVDWTSTNYIEPPQVSKRDLDKGSKRPRGE